MKTIISNSLAGIQKAVKDSLESIVSGLRVSKAGNIQIFLTEQCDSSLQEEFKSSIETLNPDLTIRYQENLDQYGEPETYNNNGKKTKLSPAIVICEIKEPKSLDSMFSDLTD
tara:strand:+ start:183 stop:521 length:339 start_codon:yes stop_codon:yes gene_type:complete